MFGSIMQFAANQHNIKLAPISKDEVNQFVTDGGMQLNSVTRYLNGLVCPVLEDEYEWYEKARIDRTSITWGVYVEVKKEWRLIGTTALHLMTDKPYKGAVSGFMIFRPEWWGKGIATHCHRARTMYAFDKLNLTVVRSAVMTANEASRKAIERIGYVQVSIERNAGFSDGRWLHMRNFEMVNPSRLPWQSWWHGENPGKAFREARKRTLAALEWARANVELL